MLDGQQLDAEQNQGSINDQRLKQALGLKTRAVVCVNKATEGRELVWHEYVCATLPAVTLVAYQCVTTGNSYCVTMKHMDIILTLI